MSVSPSCASIVMLPAEVAILTAESPIVTLSAATGLAVPATKFEAVIYILSKEEGGRHTPFF